jgi:hypothetical protein
MWVQVAVMDVTQIPQTLPPAITVSRELVEFSLAEDLTTYGADGPAALAWQWALNGQGPTPVSLRDWHRGPPDHETLLDESRWPYGDKWGGRAARAEIDKARFLLWWLTTSPDEQMPARFQHYQQAPAPAAVEHGAVTATLTEVYNSDTPRPRC